MSARELQDRRRRELEARRVRRLLGDGGLGGRSGLVAPTRRARSWLSDQPNPMPEPLRGETIIFDQIDEYGNPVPVTVSSSLDLPVRLGGPRVGIVCQLTSAFTAAGELTLYRNGVSFTTMVLPTGETQILETFEQEFVPLDRARTAVTGAGAGGAGIAVAWWMGGI